MPKTKPTVKKIKLKCNENHCHDCTGCDYERPMTKGEAEIAKGLDEFFTPKKLSKKKPLTREELVDFVGDGVGKVMAGPPLKKKFIVKVKGRKARVREY